MAQLEGVKFGSSNEGGQRSGNIQAPLTDITIFALFFVLSSVFVIMAGYFVMARF